MTKRILTVLVAFVVIVSVTGLAIAQDFDTKIQKQKAYIKVLEKKLAVAKAKKQLVRVATLKKLLVGERAVLGKLIALKKLEEATPMVKPEAIPEAPVAAPAPSAPPAVAPAPPAPKPAVKPAAAPAPVEKPMGVGIWGRAGLIGGIMGGMGEISYTLSNLVDWDFVKGVDLSAGGIYIQGKDSTSVERKVAALTLGGYIDVTQWVGLTAPWVGYLGGGLNYPLKDSGNDKGNLGGQIFGGGAYKFDVNNSVFGEVGYTILRSGTGATTPYSIKSLQATVGYKYAL